MKDIDGKKFECIACGKCCKWEGVVVLNPKDIDSLSKFLSISKEKFLEEYTKLLSAKRILKDKNNKECIFLKDNKCIVWESKPDQCAEYPKKFDSRCPGFEKEDGGLIMSDKTKEDLKKVQEKLAGNGFEKKLVDEIYNGLQKTMKSASIIAVASENGIDPFLNENNVKIASLDDIFSFERIGNNQLIHRCTKDLWTIDSDKDGNVQIKRLFDNSGEPIKG